MVRIKAQAQSGVAPKWVMLAPVIGVENVLRKAGWAKEEVDLYELNEAFSVQALGVTKELGLDLTKVNVNGGAVAIGHPIGASGARVLVTLIHEMMRRDVRRGVAALCLGGGTSDPACRESGLALEWKHADCGAVHGPGWRLRAIPDALSRRGARSASGALRAAC